MSTSSFVKRALAGLAAGCAMAMAQTPNVRVFDAAQTQEVYRVLLDRDALLLEAITDVIKQKNIQDGHVMVTAGSVQECTYHYVVNTEIKPKDEYKTVKGPFEILGGGGIIADGLPHLHISIAGPGQSAIGGHLEKGCKILYLGEVTIVKYKGQALTRKPNQHGIGILQAK